MPDSTPTSVQPARVLGGIDATCIVVGAIVGVGIFLNPSQVALLAGSSNLAIAAWAVAGLIALCGALAFAELGGMYNSTGAQYEILRDAYGPLAGFLFVFCNSTAIQAGSTAIIAVICAGHLGIAVGTGEPEGFALLVLAGTLIVGLMGANIVGVRWGSRIQNITVFSKVLALIAVTAIAAFATPHLPAGVTEPAPVIDATRRAGHGVVAAIVTALVPAFFAYGGWQHALWIAGEVRDPRRTLPRAIVGGVVVVVVIYVSVNWAYLKLLGFDGVVSSKSLAADAVGSVFPGWTRRVIAAAVAVSAYGVLNAQLLSGPRLVFAMARDGRFFRSFGALNSRFATPWAAILLIGIMALVLLFAASQKRIDQLVTGVVFVDGVFFALTVLALLILRRKRPNADRPVRVIGYPVVPLLFVLGEVGLLTGALMEETARKAALIGIAWIVAGVVLFVVRFRVKKAV